MRQQQEASTRCAGDTGSHRASARLLSGKSLVGLVLSRAHLPAAPVTTRLGVKRRHCRPTTLAGGQPRALPPQPLPPTSAPGPRTESTMKGLYMVETSPTGPRLGVEVLSLATRPSLSPHGAATRHTSGAIPNDTFALDWVATEAGPASHHVGVRAFAKSERAHPKAPRTAASATAAPRARKAEATRHGTWREKARAPCQGRRHRGPEVESGEPGGNH